MVISDSDLESRIEIIPIPLASHEKKLPIPISSRVAVDLGGGDGVVNRLTVRQAVGQAGGVATERQGKREVQGKPGVANLFLII